MRELTAAQADDLYELITDRAGRSLILTSNRAPADWYPLFPNPVVAESLLDRLINTSHQVFMNGPSYRPNKRPGRVIPTQKEEPGDRQAFCSSGRACVLVDQAVEDRFSTDLLYVDVGHGGADTVAFVVGNALRNALVRPGGVVVRLVFGQDGLQVLLAEDQDAVEELAAQGAIAARPAQCSRPTWRRSTAFSCRSTNSSASFAESQRNIRAGGWIAGGLARR